MLQNYIYVEFGTSEGDSNGCKVVTVSGPR